MIQEPRRQFLTSSKMHPILIGINKDSVMRVDCKSKQVISNYYTSIYGHVGWLIDTRCMEL